MSNGIDAVMVEGLVGLAEKAAEVAFRAIASSALDEQAKKAYLARLPARLDETNAAVQAAPVFDPDARPTGPRAGQDFPDPGPTAPVDVPKVKPPSDPITPTEG